MLAIGIDIGGSSVKGMVIAGDKTILYETVLPTDIVEGRDSILFTLEKVIEDLLSVIPSAHIQGIGIASAGVINPHTGRVEQATDNLPGWRGFELKQWAKKTFSLPVFTENDANAALLGELWLDSSEQPAVVSHAVMLTLGTGVGGANLFFGKLMHGFRFQSGDWGHVVLFPGGRRCNCGKMGCVEQYLSGTALVKRANSLSTHSYKDGEEVFINRKLDEAAEQAVKEFIDHLSIVIGNISRSVDPDILLIGGGVAESERYWWKELTKKLHSAEISINLKPARYLNKAGMFGAAKLVFNAERSKERNL